MWRQAVAKQSLCLPGWMEAYNLCQLLTRKTEDAAATFNLKQNSSGEEASVFYEKTNMQYLLEHTQTHTCFLLHVSLLVASLRSKKLWYCQMQAVYLSLKWSQAARNSLKKQVSKIQSEQVHSSEPTPYPLPCAYFPRLHSLLVWCLFFISNIQLCLSILKGPLTSPPLPL